MSQKSYTPRNMWCNHSIRCMIFGFLCLRHGFQSQILIQEVDEAGF
jgi:hypothetical protein